MTDSITTSATSIDPADAALLNATVIAREDLTDELAIVRVAPDGDLPEFKPGQYATLGVLPDPDSDKAKKKGLGKMILRPYSVSSSPINATDIEFYLALVPEGELTPKLWKMQPGDRCYMAPKLKGKFTLDGIPADRDLIMIATGTGLAPFMSMVKTYRDTGRWRSATVIHGTRFCADLGYRAELEQLVARDDTIRYIPTCSREPEPDESTDWLGLRGRVNVAIEEHTFRDLAGVELSPESCHVLLCGNPAMIDDIVGHLKDRGFTPKDREHPDGNIHFEKYW